ncbi:hypothetical protein HanIR_Chr10g0489121 [Helianthus annuus]|nr:hypothetical protein HanIR_Chr10g0489121 [Helianthus annuus]
MGGDGFRLRGISSNTLSALTVNDGHTVNTKLVEEEDVVQQIEDQEQEIMQLRRHLAEFEVKEARIESEKNVLEKRIGSMYKGFEQQQQEFDEARLKAMDYRQEIIEENVRLEYALQVARDEDSVFVKSLVPLLAEQSLYPASLDAYTIVSNLRVLFKHQKERLAIAEERLKDSQYQPLVLHSRMKEVALNDPARSEWAHSSFSQAPEPVHMERPGDDVVNTPYLPSILEEEHEQEPSSSSHQEADDSEEDDYDDVDYTNKPLPTIEDLQIIGDPFPGNEIQASGYPRNGTKTCRFEWVRLMQDGSMKYIEGAKQPTYIVTADDLDNSLAVIVQPLDDRQREGELVKCFANDNKITCHPDMLREIERSVCVGHVSVNVFVLRRSPDSWEPAILEIKKSGYSIKLNGSNNGVVVADKYTPTTVINLPAEEPLQFSIVGPHGVEQYLCADYNASGISCSRDAIVLTMRSFVKRAVDKKLGKKKKRRGLFF